MSNLFFNLPVPVGNGVGTPIDVSALGGTKTIIASGSSVATLNVEINNDPSQDGGWQSVATFHNGGFLTVQSACRFMRVRVSAYNTLIGGTSVVDVGGTDAGTTFAALPVPAADGVDSTVDVSGLDGLFKTVQVGGSFKGTLLVEISEDGSSFAQPFSFQTPNAQSLTVAARLMRVRRVGVPLVDPGGIPVVNVGVTTISEGGGGSESTDLLVFEYIVSGNEPDLSEITIPLPSPITSDYGVTGSCQGVTAIVAFDFPKQSQTQTDFLCISTAELSTGDVLLFFVAPLTVVPT